MNSKLALNINIAELTDWAAWYLCCSQSNSPQLSDNSLSSFDVRDRPMSIARVYSDQTLFDEPTRAVMNVTRSPASLTISKLIPADSGKRRESIVTGGCWFKVSNIIIFNQHWQYKGTQTGLCLSRTNCHLARFDLLTFRFIQMQSGFQEISHKTCPLESHCYRYLLV